MDRVGVSWTPREPALNPHSCPHFTQPHSLHAWKGKQVKGLRDCLWAEGSVWAKGRALASFPASPFPSGPNPPHPPHAPPPQLPPLTMTSPCLHQELSLADLPSMGEAIGQNDTCLEPKKLYKVGCLKPPSHHPRLAANIRRNSAPPCVPRGKEEAQHLCSPF